VKSDCPLSVSPTYDTTHTHTHTTRHTHTHDTTHTHTHTYHKKDSMQLLLHEIRHGHHGYIYYPTPAVRMHEYVVTPSYLPTLLRACTYTMVAALVGL
jgi:hypothetical protein